MKYYVLLFFTLWFCPAKAQNVYTELNLNKPEDLRADYPVSEITTEMTFYNSNGTTEKKKEIAILNAQNNIISELRYNQDGVLTERLTHIFDSTGTKSLGRKFERWHPIIGYTSETSFHTYDSNGYLIKTTDKNQNQEVFMETTIINDDHGNPIEVSTRNGKGILFGIEKATYDYADNQVITRVFNSEGEQLSETTGKINYDSAQDQTIIRNEQGDVIKSEDDEYEYRYDKKNNWTEMIRYKIKNGIRIKQSVFTRKIKYKK